MKTISIEQVTNGWIVRPFSACEGWARAEQPSISVFNNMHEMQAALPQFFEMPDPLVKNDAWKEGVEAKAKYENQKQWVPVKLS